MAARFEPDSLMEAAEKQIMQVEYARSMREPPWDGKMKYFRKILYQKCQFLQYHRKHFLGISGFLWFGACLTWLFRTL